MLGLGRSVARMSASGTVPPSIRSGTLLEIVRWAAPEGRPLRVWAPASARDLRNIARRFAAAAKAKWIADPLEGVPTHVLRPRGDGWELLDRERRTLPLAGDDAAAAAIARLPRGAALFVQFPAPRQHLASGVVATDSAAADYILTGRYDGRRIEYAWIRPDGGSLPGRSAWTRDDARLRADLLKLRRLHAWHSLQSPPNTPAPYRLALRHEATGALLGGAPVLGGEAYSVVLRAWKPRPAGTVPRYYYYAFAIDSHGRSYLVFPKSGSVENRFPIQEPAPPEIAFGAPSAFGVMPPYGPDTYVLLSTEEPLPNSSILEWDGVRAPSWKHPLTPLETLLWQTITGARGKHSLVTSAWSIERITLASAAPPRRRASAARAAPRRR
jgi:hypothetical protein